MSIKKIKLQNEPELKALLIENLGAIEEGMIFIASEVNAHENKRIDILAQDKNDTIVVIELKLFSDSNVLVQILDYGDFAYRHYSTLFNRYPTMKKDNFDPDNIRLVIIAEDFSSDLLRVIPYIDWEIEVYKFQAFTLKDEKSLLCLPVEIEPLPPYEKEEIRTVDRLLEYITNDVAKEAAKEVLKYCESLGAIQIEPTKEYIACKVHGKNFMTINPRRQYFHVDYRDPKDGLWYYDTVNSKEEFTQEVKKSLLESFKFVSNS